jgi:ribosome-associated toxin RatA of RatAB toxin-antitoxin module
MEKRILPHEPKYMYELITEARLYKLFGVALLEERIKDLCLCKLAVD